MCVMIFILAARLLRMPCMQYLTDTADNILKLIIEELQNVAIRP